MTRLLLAISIPLLPTLGVVAMAAQPQEHSKLPPERLAALHALHTD